MVGKCCFGLMKNVTKQILLPELDRIVEMAWEDRTPFEAILIQFGLSESEVIEVMRNELKRSSFNRWRKRVQGRSTKHVSKRSEDVLKFKCSRQKSISLNNIT